MYGQTWWVCLIDLASPIKFHQRTPLAADAESGALGCVPSAKFMVDQAESSDTNFAMAVPTN